MQNIKYLIWLTILDLCPKNVIKYLEKNKIEELWKAREISLNKYFTKEEISKILNKKYRQNLQLYEEYIKKYGIKLITIQDQMYPQKLKNIENPPIILYTIGNIEILNDRQIAIVGARRCTEYGSTVAKAFAYSLSKKNITITSGLAQGIDKAAHEGTLLAKGKTIAVVGTGLDIIYPKENKELFEDIISNNGLIISEYPLGVKPEKQNFPKRNRIISAISNGVLVVEAGEKSGALITVDFALEQGKNVYAVPRKYIKH